MAGGGSTARVAPSRPHVAVDGRESPSLAEGILSLRLHEDVTGLFSCECRFGNWGAKDGKVTFLYFDRQVLDFGKEITLTLDTDRIFRGRITGLEAGFPENQTPWLTVLAEDRYQDLRMVRRTRTFADVSDSDVFNHVASDHGLTPDVQVSGPTYRLLAQLNQSDLAFLRDRARTIDAELWMNDSTLSVRSRSDRRGETLTLGYGNELREFTILADLAGQRSDVTVGGWDVSSKQALAETAGVSLVSGELNGGQSGSAVLSTALGQRRDSVVASVPLSSREAQAHAETIYKRMARRFLTGRGVAETSSKLRVGARVTLQHLGDLFSGEYYVTEVLTTFDDAQGLRTEFAVERPALGGSTS
ncbi:MAG: uncharacterized protein QOH66_1552 [Actinomycetota bacterium]|jgi:phage protein D|nr:uncharacterized protein [Actinomycetota bacterium]